MTHPTEPKLPENLEAIRAALDAFPEGWHTVFHEVREHAPGLVELGALWEDSGELAEVITVDTGNYYDNAAAMPMAKFIAACNPKAITALLDALKARDAEIERLRGALSAILSDSLDADSETNVPPALYAQGIAAIDQARAEGGEKTK